MNSIIPTIMIGFLEVTIFLTVAIMIAMLVGIHNKKPIGRHRKVTKHSFID